MGYTYQQFQIALASEMAIPNNNYNDPNFLIILPTIIDYAEQRCYRELDLLYATSRQTVSLVALSRNLNLSSLTPYLIIFQDGNIITPYTQTNPDQGVRNQLIPVSKEWLDAVYNDPSVTGVPRFMAMLDDVTVLLGPFPDQAYTVEVIGKFRPTPLYDPASVNGTWLSIYLPDLFLAAAMISAMGYRRNFGAQSDDPRSAVSWETQFQSLLPSAKSEETRKNFLGWQQLSAEHTPTPNA